MAGPFTVTPDLSQQQQSQQQNMSNTQPNTITGGKGPVNQTQPPQFTLQEQQPSQPSQHGNFQPNQQAAQPQLPSQQGQVLQPQTAQPQVPSQQGQVLQPQTAQPQVPSQQGQVLQPQAAQPQVPNQQGQVLQPQTAQPQVPSQQGQVLQPQTAQPQVPNQQGQVLQPQAAQPQVPNQQGQVLQPQAAQPQVPNQQGQVLQPQAAQPQVPNQQGQVLQPQAAQPQVPNQQGQVLQPQAAQPQVPNQQGQVLQPQAAQPQVPNQQGQQPQETEQSLQQAAYSYFKTQNSFQSFWNALPQGIADNPIVQPLGPSKQKWVRLEKLLGYVQALQGVQYDPNDVLRTFVDAGIWDVSNEGFNLLVFKDDHIWNGIPSVLLEEIKQYRDSGQMTWTSSEYDTTVGLITTVFQGELFRPYFKELADTAASWRTTGFALNAGNPLPKEGNGNDDDDDGDDDDDDNDGMKGIETGDGRDRARNYGSQKNCGAVLASVSDDDHTFHKMLHPMIYILYHKLHKAYNDMEEHVTPGGDWKKLQTKVPEIETVSNKIILHMKQCKTETLALSLADLLREWDFYWSGRNQRDVREHLERLWLRESFPKAWIMVPLEEKPPLLKLNGLYPSDDERKQEWIRYYGCDPDTGEPLDPAEINARIASIKPTTTQESSPQTYHLAAQEEHTTTQEPAQTYYPAAQVVAKRMDSLGAIARIPPPTQGSKSWLAKQSIPSHGFKSQTIQPQYTDEGQLIVAYKEYPQRGFDSKGQRLVRRIYVVKNELANGCVQYLIRSQVDCGGGGVWKKLNKENTPQIDSIPKIGSGELEQGDWLRENSDPPWEVPWVAMPPETAWDGETIPEMAVCFRFTIDGKTFEQVFHRTLLHKYVPPKGVGKAILNCFGMPEMPSLEEFFYQYRAQRQYLQAQQDLKHRHQAITYGSTEKPYGSRRTSKNTRSRARRNATDDEGDSSDEDSDQAYEPDTPEISADEEDDPPAPRNTKRTKQKKKSKKTKGASAGSELQILQDQVKLQGESLDAILAKLSTLSLQS